MLNLNASYFSAQDVLSRLRKAEERREAYPRVVARELMRCNYYTSVLFRRYALDADGSAAPGSLSFESLKAEMEQLKEASERDFSEFINVSRSQKVGGLSYADIDAEAAGARFDDALLEEIEYSFLTFYITFDLVLRYIVLLNEGHSAEEAVAALTDGGAAGKDAFTYTGLTGFFLKHCVAPFLSMQLRKGIVSDACRFPADRFSEATSNFSEYINATPVLVAFIKANPQFSESDIVLSEFLKRQSEPDVIRRVELLKAEFGVLNKNRGDSKLVVDSLKLLDQSDLLLIEDYFCDEVYHPQGILRSLLYDCSSLLDVRRTIYTAHGDMSDLPDEFYSCEHPYVLSEVALHLMSGDVIPQKALVFLQWALNTAFNSPNHFWHNCDAVCGCTEALLAFRQLLFLNNTGVFERYTGVSFFHCLYLYLSRSVVLCRRNLMYANVLSERVPMNAVRIAIYEMELADLIALYRSVLLRDFLSDAEVDCVIGVHRTNARQILLDWGLHMLALSVGESHASNGDFLLTALMMNVFDNYVYTLYRQGAMYVSESVVSDAIQFLSAQLQNGADDYSASLSSYLENHGQAERGGYWRRTLSQHQKDVVAIATQKDDKLAYEKFFTDHGITRLYHFTDRRNLESIRKYGLLSAFALRQNQMEAYYGGDEHTQQKDREFGLDDYVRLSFHKRHPMGRRLKMEEKNRDFVILEISPEVAYSQDTLFSDKNAAMDDHVHGATLQHLHMVNMEAVNAEYSPIANPIHEQRAAEVMVKHKIPLEYILNIADPESF